MTRISRAIAIIALFGVVGPPVGGLVAWVMMGARSLRSPLPFITGSYGEGAILAVLVGVVCCVAALTLRSVSWLVPIVTAIVVCAAALVVGAAIDPNRPEMLGAVLRMASVFLLPSVVAAVVCWALGRRLLRDV